MSEEKKLSDCVNELIAARIDKMDIEGSPDVGAVLKTMRNELQEIALAVQHTLNAFNALFFRPMGER